MISYDSIEEYYFKGYLPEIKKKINDFISEMGDRGKCMKLRYLYENVFEIEREIAERVLELQDCHKKGGRHEILLISGPLESLKKKLAKYEAQIEFLVNKPKTKRDMITQEMIEHARDYPIENLIEFKKGFAFCPVHAEKTPSFHWFPKTNSAHCFGCHKHFDSIDLFMLLNNTTFQESVRRLQ